MAKNLIIGALIFIGAILFVMAIRPAAPRPDYVDARGLFCHYSAVRDYLCWPRDYK
jgi:hypothetical protein